MSTSTFPEYWSFKPFFTLQPVASTREKQLRCWTSFILRYCSQNNVTRLDPAAFPYFKNEAIGRELSREGINAVVDSLIGAGNAEWEDASRTGLRIILKSPESLAGDIYVWVLKNGFAGTVFTIFELHSGEDHEDSGFFGCDPIILRRALTILERECKCHILAGSNPDEDGVKFLAVSS